MAVKNISLRRLGLVLCVGLFVLAAARYVALDAPHPRKAELVAAATLMQSCSEAVREFKESLSDPLNDPSNDPSARTNPLLDPNRTGLIGPEYAEFTTTLGNLEAKRTATNPAFAAVLVRYFLELGLKKGDVVAVGASGSFPGMTLATLSAARVLELEPRLVYSFGASMYGAGSKECTFLEMMQVWRERGLLPYSALAVSLGGDNDQADDLIFPEARAFFVQKAETCGLPYINEPNLDAAALARLPFFGDNVRCFVNVGGASVNMGRRGFAMRLPNGIIRPENARELSDGGDGVAAHFLRLGVPVIHLLDMRSLALRNGIPIDPKPFPAIGEGPVFNAPREASSHTLRIILLCVGLIVTLGLLIRFSR